MNTAEAVRLISIKNEQNVAMQPTFTPFKTEMDNVLFISGPNCNNRLIKASMLIFRLLIMRSVHSLLKVCREELEEVKKSQKK